MDFIVATGIECSAPIIRGGIRRDQLLMSDHWRRYEEDFDLVAGLGITHLRYGVPFHVVAREAAAFDWTWTDLALEALRARGIEPIADLLHFAVPDRFLGIGDPAMPAAFLAYAQRSPIATRGSLYTPVNEPFITALFSAKRGWWNERQRSDRAFVQALDNVVTCAVEGMRVIRQRRSDAVFLQSDACESFLPADADSVRRATFFTERAYLGLRSHLRSPGESGDAAVASPGGDEQRNARRGSRPRLRRELHPRPRLLRAQRADRQLRWPPVSSVPARLRGDRT